MDLKFIKRIEFKIMIPLINRNHSLDPNILNPKVSIKSMQRE